VAESLFYAVFLGLILGVVFDFFRFLRFVFNDKFFFDFFFWIISAICVFCYLLIFNYGDIRAIYLVFILIGFLTVTFTLGYVSKPIQQKVAKKIKIRLKSLKKVLQKLYSIYYNIVAKRKTLMKKKFKGDKNGKASKQKE
jgi:cytochrome c biogenesis factor